MCYSVLLEPGDVLFVPRHWWHQVTTVSPWSLSVNTWLPHPHDNTARLAEALVRWQLANTIRHLDRSFPLVKKLAKPQKSGQPI